jgi:hypothetical protein
MHIPSHNYAEVARFNLPSLLVPQLNPKLPTISPIQKGTIRAPVHLLDLGGVWARLPTSRAVENFSSDKMISDIYSYKMGVHVRCESTLERDTAYLLDWAPAVASFRSQPERLAYELEGRLRHTTPDFEVYVHGVVRPGLIEVKPEEKAKRIDSIAKSHAVKSTAMRSDIHYGYLTCKEIRQQPRLDNVKRIRRYAFRPVASELLAFIEAEASGGTKLGALRSKACSVQHDPFSLFTLMYWGVLRFDIDEQLDDNLLVRLGDNSHA